MTTNSELLYKADAIEVIVDGGPLPLSAIENSDLLYKADHLEIIIAGETFTRIGIEGSDLILTSNNIQYIVKGATLIPPINTKLRQIYSDGIHVYGATEKGLVVFKP